MFKRTSKAWLFVNLRYTVKVMPAVTEQCDQFILPVTSVMGSGK